MMGWGLSEQGWRKGPWTADEDKLLSEYVKLYGEGRWSSVASTAGLNRSGKSCRLRWVNYLRPGLKRGQITPLEEGIIIELHALWGNKWSTIARYLPGRTDNEIKNYWRTHFKNKDKSSHQTKEKQKAEVLKQKRQNIEQKQELEQHNDDDMKMVDSNHNTAGDGEMLQDAQRQRQMLFMYPILEDQCLPVMYQDVASCADSVTEDGGLWGGLWDLDDPYTSNYCNKMAMQNQAANLSFGRGGPN